MLSSGHDMAVTFIDPQGLLFACTGPAENWTSQHSVMDEGGAHGAQHWPSRYWQLIVAEGWGVLVFSGRVTVELPMLQICSSIHMQMALVEHSGPQSKNKKI